MNEITVKVSLDGRKGLVEIADDPIIFKSAEINKYHLLNYFQNILNRSEEHTSELQSRFSKYIKFSYRKISRCMQRICKKERI